MTLQPGPVVIGINGSPSDESVLRLGAAEARRLDVPVRLVHVVPDYVAISPLVPITYTDFGNVGDEVVRRAVAGLGRIDDQIEAETEIHHGPRSRRIVEAADGASAIVVGRDDRPVLERLLRGNTATGVAATATCPVLVVPSDWNADAPTGEVLVGVKSPAHAQELLADAFELASARDARLVILHTWKLPSEYDDVIETHVAGDDWTRRAHHVLEVVVADWRRAYPDVEVELRVVHAQPAAGLIEASRSADVLVVVRRARGVPAATHLGSTARTLLRLAHCPVRVVPAQTLTELPPGLALEVADTLSKREVTSHG